MLTDSLVELDSDLGTVDPRELAALANDPEIQRTIGGHSFPYPYTVFHASYFIDRNREINGRPFAIDFAIRDAVSHELVGIIGLSDLDSYDLDAHVGYWIGRKFWGMGYATRALSLVCDFAFRDLGMHRLHTRVLEDNLRSLRVLMKNGFQVEGYMRECFLRDGEFLSMFILGRINPYTGSRSSDQSMA
ncbi:GNAT family acetyltransferase [Thermogymnomonas acidicola]|uniref:GNAT family acetyltransferase n=1 Tax=Thermogymnomonas acidicola TaxID=399579 RepID=A0AA37BQA3_9ARCH|nr:GNAT family acetyltransferase [Thermogymnomonas acidicola]